MYGVDGWYQDSSSATMLAGPAGHRPLCDLTLLAPGGTQGAFCRYAPSGTEIGGGVWLGPDA